MSVYSPSVYTPQLDKKNGDRLRFNYYARFEVASGISGSRSLRYSLFFLLALVLISLLNLKSNSTNVARMYHFFAAILN